MSHYDSILTRCQGEGLTPPNHGFRGGVSVLPKVRYRKASSGHELDRIGPGRRNRKVRNKDIRTRAIQRGTGRNIANSARRGPLGQYILLLYPSPADGPNQVCVFTGWWRSIRRWDPALESPKY